MREKIRTLAIILIVMALFWLLWEKIFFMLWLRLPWWALFLLIGGFLITLDLGMDKLLGKKL